MTKELFIEPFWNMAGVNLRKIILPTAFSPSWVSSEKCAWSLEIHFDQLQVLVSQLSTFKKCLEIAYETVKLLPSTKSTKIKEKITRLGN